MFNKFLNGTWAKMDAEGSGGGDGGDAGTGEGSTIVADGGEEAPANWSDGFEFSDDDRGFMQNKDFYEDPTKMLKSYRELEKHVGIPPDKIMRKPEPDDAEGWSKFMQNIGLPETSEGYTFKHEEGTQVDQDFETSFKQVAFEAGILPDGAQKMVDWWAKQNADADQFTRETMDAENLKEETALKREWGAKYEERLDLAKRAGDMFFKNDEEFDALSGIIGPKRMAEAFGKLGDMMSDDDIVNFSQRPAFGTTKEQIENQIKEIMEDVALSKERVDALKLKQGPDHRKLEQLWAQLEKVL